jgi:hypothetical protein
MKRIRTPAHLQAELDDEFSWRVQELHNMKEAVAQRRDLIQSTLLRAAIPILYAHWEGFIKNGASIYAIYLSNQGLRFSEVLHCFSGLRALGRVREIEGIRRRIFTPSALLQQIYQIPDEAVFLPLQEYISNVGNLNFGMFEQVVQFLGLNTAPYSTREKFIDQSLLEARNTIAHGERASIDRAGFEDLLAEVIGLMRHFKNDIENAVATKSYMRP